MAMCHHTVLLETLHQLQSGEKLCQVVSLTLNILGNLAPAELCKHIWVIKQGEIQINNWWELKPESLVWDANALTTD